MRDDRSGEAGFTLIEVLICVALVVSGCVVVLGLLPTLVRASQADLLRDAATNIARAEIERARAATAYYPVSGFTASHAYALNATAAYATSAHVHRDYCGAGTATTDVPMNVSDAYTAADDALTVTVLYPNNPCIDLGKRTVVLTAQLAPSALIPGTTVSGTIGDPALQ